MNPILFWIAVSTVCFLVKAPLDKYDNISNYKCYQKVAYSTSPIIAQANETVYRVDTDTRTFCERYGHWWFPTKGCSWTEKYSISIANGDCPYQYCKICHIGRKKKITETWEEYPQYDNNYWHTKHWDEQDEP